MAVDTLVRELFLKRRTLALACWRLPHDLRRNLFRLFFARKHKIYEDRLVFARGNLLKKGLFIHVPKTAGMSVTRALYGNEKPVHLTIAHYQTLFSETEFNNTFKFAFVRNPWDRMVSSYTFLTSGGYTENDRIFSRNILSRFATFADFVTGWVKPENLASRIHFLPQYFFVCDPNGKQAVDFIGRFENLSDDFSHIAGKMGVTNTLEHRNASPNRDKDYRSYYDNESMEIVWNIYKRDIELFQYAF